MSAAEVVAKGKTEGIKFTPQLVYRVRGRSSGKAKKAAVKMTTSPTVKNGNSPAATMPGAQSSAEDLLRAIAAELGLGMAVEILAGERARVRAVIGG